MTTQRLDSSWVRKPPGRAGMVYAPEGGQRSSTKGRLVNRGYISIRESRSHGFQLGIVHELGNVR